MLAFLIWGSGFGGVTPLSEYTWTTYFSRRHLGAVRSLGVPAQLGATSLGPLLVAIWFDMAASYDDAFLAMVAVCAVGAAVVLAMSDPGIEESGAQAAGAADR